MKAKHTSDDELRDWMDRMRGRCEVLESTPEPAISDAGAAPAAVPEAAAVEPAGTAGTGKRLGDEDLQDLMARRRGRCEVLESMPSAATADARSADAVTRTSAAVLKTINDEESDSLQPMRALRAALRQGPLDPGARQRVWPSLLTTESDEGEDSNATTRQDEISLEVPLALTELLSSGESSGQPQPDSSDLAAQFCKKHLAWLNPQGIVDDQGDMGWTSDRRVFMALAQLLRYHSPVSAVKMEAICKTAGYDIAAALCALCNSCGMAVTLPELLFEMPEEPGEAECCVHALRVLCDAVVLEGKDLALLYVILLLLSEITLEPNCTFPKLEEELRAAVTLRSLGKRSAAEVCCCLAEAIALLQTTPVSLRGALSRRGRTGARLDLPMCTVAPEEVLHHTHKESPCGWRLIVADVRMRANNMKLPVSFPISRAQYSQRLKELCELPEDESVHLCLLGDASPKRGDDAYELCRKLIGPGNCRRHVSIVEGGWPAVEERAAALGLDLMTQDAEEARDTELGGYAAVTAEVAAVTAEVAAIAKQGAAEASAAGSRVAQMARGAGRYLGSLLDYADGMVTPSPDPAPDTLAKNDLSPTFRGAG